MEVVSPVTEHTIDDGAKIKLGAKSIEHGTLVGARGRKSCLVYLKRVSAFGWLHGQVNNRVELDILLVGLDRLKGLGKNM